MLRQEGWEHISCRRQPCHWSSNSGGQEFDNQKIPRGPSVGSRIDIWISNGSSWLLCHTYRPSVTLVQEILSKNRLGTRNSALAWSTFIKIGDGHSFLLYLTSVLLTSKLPNGPCVWPHRRGTSCFWLKLVKAIKYWGLVLILIFTAHSSHSNSFQTIVWNNVKSSTDRKLNTNNSILVCIVPHFLSFTKIVWRTI